MKKQKFTVILMYPDYSTDNYGETWCAAVDARNPVEAVEVAQKQCAGDSTVIDNPDDLLPISVFEGDHKDLIGVWAEAQHGSAPVQVRTV